MKRLVASVLCCQRYNRKQVTDPNYYLETLMNTITEGHLKGHFGITPY